VGRIAPRKGLSLLIEALCLISDLRWHLTIVGDGTSPDELLYAARFREEASYRLGSERVVFSGRLDESGVRAALSKADIFINLSSTGSLDKAIVESMACGCPVISSNDAFKEIALNEGFTECIAEGGAQRLSEKIIKFGAMSTDSRRNIGDLQSEVAIRDHCLDGLAAKLSQILSDRFVST